MRIRPYSRPIAETVAAYLDCTQEIRRLIALLDEHGIRYDPETIAAEAMARLDASQGSANPYSALFLARLTSAA